MSCGRPWAEPSRARCVAADDGPWLALTFANRMAFIYAMRRSWPLRQALRGGLRFARSPVPAGPPFRRAGRVGEAHRPSQLRSREHVGRLISRASFASGGQSTVPERGGRKPPLNQGGAVAPLHSFKNDLRPPNVKERPGALAAASTRYRATTARGFRPSVLVRPRGSWTAPAGLLRRGRSQSRGRIPSASRTRRASST